MSQCPLCSKQAYGGGEEQLLLDVLGRAPGSMGPILGEKGYGETHIETGDQLVEYLASCVD